jgi:hypothetical protein
MSRFNPGVVALGFHFFKFGASQTRPEAVKCDQGRVSSIEARMSRFVKKL